MPPARITSSFSVDGDSPRSSRCLRTSRSCSSVSERCCSNVRASSGSSAMSGALRSCASACDSIECASVRYFVSCFWVSVMDTFVPGEADAKLCKPWAVDFAEFVLRHLPDPPARVLEVGCGEEGGVTPELAAAGYEPLAIDPRAPAGRWYRRVTLQELDDDGPFAATVCGRVLHHVRPLGPALDRLVGLAPVLVADEF